MGNFTQQIFSVMLAWMRTAITQLWDVFNSQDAQAGLVWIGNNWIWLVVMLSIIGIVIDTFVWLIRWRPFYVWGSSLRRFMGRFKKQEATPKPRNNRQMPVAESDSGFAPYAAYGKGETQMFASREAATYAKYQQAYEQAPEYEDAQYEEDYYEEPQYEEPYYGDTYDEEPAYEEAYDQEPYYPTPPAYQTPAYFEPSPGKTERSRRSAKTRRRTGLLTGIGQVAKTLKAGLSETDDDEELIAYMPPKPRVPKAQAFHTPVYPPTWQSPYEESEDNPEDE